MLICKTRHTKYKKVNMITENRVVVTRRMLLCVKREVGSKTNFVPGQARGLTSLVAEKSPEVRHIPENLF